MSEGRTALVTGATSGHGRAVAHELARRGHTVIVHGRDAGRVEAVRAELREAGGAEPPPGRVADLASLEEVHRLADEVAATDRLDVLVNNAGVFAAGGKREVSTDGHELTLAVNHLAHFALTLRLLDLLRASAPARIVNVSSAGQAPIDPDDLMLERGWEPWRAYMQSKLAQVMFTRSLAERLDPGEVTATALHPATFMDTPMVRSFTEPASTAEEGADATVRLAVDPGLGA